MAKLRQLGWALFCLLATPGVCWAEWLQHQTMLINHYGLNVRDPDAKKFLMENMEKYLFSTGDADEVDTSKQGTISW